MRRYRSSSICVHSLAFTLPLLLLILQFPHHASGYSSSSSDERIKVERHMLGGYSGADISEERVVTAAKFAASALQKGEEHAPPSGFYGFVATDDYNVVVLEAQQQVVAGMNYRIKVGLTDTDGKCMGAFKVLVYDQFGDLSVIKWGEEVSCGEVELIIAETERKEEENGEV